MLLSRLELQKTMFLVLARIAGQILENGKLYTDKITPMSSFRHLR